MNGEIPSVPITTLAGISSLTDLLPEMPLPSPLPQTLSNKSLLFHPRVAEEAQILLSVRDDTLVPQLIQSLVQTSADHIELKDHYAGTEPPVEHQQNIPELLKAILQRNPNVFKGPQANSPHQPQWNQQQGSQSFNSTFSQASPASYGQASPSTSGYASFPSDPSPSGSRHTPQGSPAPPAAARFPAPVEVQSSPAHYLPAGQSSPYPNPNAASTTTAASLAPPLAASAKFPGSFGGASSSQQHPQQQHNFHSGSVGVIQAAACAFPSAPPNSVACASGLPTGVVSSHEHQQQQLQQQQSHHLAAARLKCPEPVDANASMRMSVITEQCRTTLLESNVVKNGSNVVFNNSHGANQVNRMANMGSNVNKTQYNAEQFRKHENSLESGLNNKLNLSDSTAVAGPSVGNSNMSKQQASTSGGSSSKQDIKLDKASNKLQPQLKLREPRVMLNRLNPEDEALMQKSLKAFAEKSPAMASKLGIVDNHRSGRHASTPKYKDEASSSESDDEPKKRSKFFKNKGKEKEEKRKKEKEERRSRPSGNDSDYMPDEDDTPVKIKKRTRSVGSDMHFNEDASPKKRTRKLEKKLVPVVQKMSTEELMETNTYQRFNRYVELIFDNTEDWDLNAELDEDADAPPEALIPKYQLQDLCSEAAKLKVLGATESIPPERLVRLLNILEKNIRDGAKVSPIADPDDDEDESKLWLELTMERVMRAVDSSLAALYILTSTNMPKRVYLEDVIDRVVLFTKYQLQNTIYPSFDPVYRIDTKSKSTSSGGGRKKKAHSKEVREKSILMLYNKLNEVVGLLSELLSIQVLTDTAVLHVSTLGVAPFFVESVSELQLSALKLVTTIFTRYEKHRRLLLDDILASIARLPSNKRSLRSYRLSSEENIQMLTALVLQLIQCVVVLPDRLHQSADSILNANSSSEKNNDNQEKDKDKKSVNVDRDVLIVSKYETAMQLAGNFLTVFLNKCGSKSEEIDYRPLFENFVQDLLTTVNKPEWPSAELLLSLLGKILVKNFMNKGIEMSLRVASLDYLGVVAARLRKDAVTSQLKVDAIDQIIREIQEEEQREAEEHGELKKKKKEKTNISPMEEEEERTQFLQRVLLDYIAVTGQGDQGYAYARHFYIVQWFRDAANEVSRPAKDAKRNSHKSNKKKKSRRKKKGSDTEEESSEESDLDDEEDSKKPKEEDPVNVEIFRLVDKRKNFLMTKIRPLDDTSGRTQVLQTYIEYESAELISRYLASKRPFSHSFDLYLIQILSVLNESSIAIRTKAMKCLTMVVEADPSVLGRTDMQLGVKHSFLDHSTSVREAAVDLVGKFVLSRPDLIDKYYDMLSQRILDTGVSVRKRVIKILKDICIECPEFEKIPEICVKMIRRVNDEEGIRKLVMEVFQNMWFTPVRERPTLDAAALLRKVMNITDVVAKCRDIGLDWFEQLLVSLFKPKEDKDDSTKVQVAPPKSLLTACKQIVDCLIEKVLSIEESSYSQALLESSTTTQGENADDARNTASQRLVACLTTLYLLAKIRPQLLIDHATTLQPYLSLKCKTQGDFQIISCVARTLELVVPLIEHPSESFMAQLEEDSVKLILQHERSVVASCLSCLGSIVNNVTQNFKLIRDCFKNYYGTLTSYKQLHLKDPNDPRLTQYRAYFRRALFTVGLLMRHFDFNSKEVNEGLADDIKNQVFETLMYFVNQPNYDVQFYTLQAIGSLCIRHYDFMLGPELKTLYHMILTDDSVQVHMRTQVLNNIEIYLQEEERRMIKQDQEWAKLSKKENLKEMGDVSSGMASTVIQLYLREVLEAFLHPNVSVRKAALRVIQLILQQGLVHPVQIVPYLICMSTDVEQCVSHSADKQLQEIEKKYPGFIHMKTQDGIWLSYKLQHILQFESNIVRGYRTKEGEMPTALNGFLYSILRNTKQQRRAITLSILKQFDEQVKTSLSQMMYLADNLAYFPYQVQDEPLFIIHHIDIVLSMSGTNLLQSFREALQVPGIKLETPEGETVIAFDEEEEEEVETLVSRITDDIKPLQGCITASQGCMLLLVLKQHLKDLYGITDAKLTQYSPSESAKVYEKALTRRSNSVFDPKVTIQKLQEGELPEVLDEAAKTDIVNQYLNFKQLMLNFDPKDPDEEEEGVGAQQNVQPKIQPIRVSTVGLTEASASDAGTSITPEVKDTPLKVPKLTIVPPRPPADSKHHKSHKTHKSERHRKHKHKKKRKKYYHSDEEEEESDFSDPDFLV